MHISWQNFDHLYSTAIFSSRMCSAFFNVPHHTGSETCTGEGFYKDALGVVYKDAMGVVYKTLNSISKRGYHVFVEECVVYKTLNSEIFLTLRP